MKRTEMRGAGRVARSGWHRWALFGALVGCGGSATRAEMPSPVATDCSADEMGLAHEGGHGAAGADGVSAGEGDVAAVPSTPPPPMVVEGENGALEGAMPTLRIVAPRPDQLIRSGGVEVRLQLSGWPLAAPTGPHVHLILDNEPYVAIRDASAPIDLVALAQQSLGHPLTEGTHVLRAFPSRGHHESVKDAGAFATVVFSYRTRTEGFAFDPSAPLLTFSRPKGCNPAGAPVLLDFFVSNATLAPNQHRVRWTLDEQVGDITRWVPHHLEHLAEGAHSLRLQLVGADGAPVSGIFNDTTRTFTVAATCP